jgi:hypothetical protein
LIDVAPSPILAGLEALYDRMVGAVEVGGGVLPDGAVAAAHVAALKAQSEMHPLLADFQALLASVRGAGLDVMNVVEMGTFAHISIYG